MILAYYIKQPAEVSDYDLDFSGWLRDGETLDSATAVTEVLGDTIASDLTVDSVTVAETAARVRLSAGTDGRRYKATVSTTTSSGRIDESEFVVSVNEI